jgi:hypothetical protein
LLVAVVAHLVHNLTIVSMALASPGRAVDASPFLVALGGVAFLLVGRQLLLTEPTR